MSKNTEYYKSFIGLIPKEWEVDIIGNLSFITKLAGFEYTNYFDYEKQGDIVALRVLNIRNGKLDLENIQTIPKSISSQLPRSSLAKNDLVISYVGTIGAVALIDESNKFHLAPNVAKISPSIQSLNPTFLLYQLLSEKCQKRLFDLSTVTSQPALSMSRLRQLSLVLPPLPEQEKIAKILSTIDRTITHTEALIEKYQQIKAGLMHDLFTRGIGADGKLRPSRDKAPELYRESSIGWIPKDWDIVCIGDITERIEQGWSPDCESEVASLSEWGVLKTSSVQWDGFYRDANKRLPNNLKPKIQYKVFVGDLIITRAGPNSRVGVVSIVRKEPGNLLLSDKLYRLILKSKISYDYILLALLSENTQRFLGGFKTGLAESQTNISQSIVKKLIIALPSKEEQAIFVEREESIRVKIDMLKDDLFKHQKIKSGLMHDLLTGTVRVNSDPV